MRRCVLVQQKSAGLKFSNSLASGTVDRALPSFELT